MLRDVFGQRRITGPLHDLGITPSPIPFVQRFECNFVVSAYSGKQLSICFDDGFVQQGLIHWLTQT